MALQPLLDVRPQTIWSHFNGNSALEHTQSASPSTLNTVHISQPWDKEMDILTSFQADLTPGHHHLSQPKLLVYLKSILQLPFRWGSEQGLIMLLCRVLFLKGGGILNSSSSPSWRGSSLLWPPITAIVKSSPFSIPIHWPFCIPRG